MVARQRQKTMMTLRSFINLQKVCKPIACQLCPGPIVTSPVTDAYVLAVSYAHLNFSEFTVGGHIRRLVRNQVLLAQFPFELLEGMFQSLHVFGDEGASARRLTELFQPLLVNPFFVPVADPYGVYHDFGAQRFFNRFRPLGKARGVVTVREEDDRLSPHFPGQHVRAGRDHRVEDGSSPFTIARDDRRRHAAGPWRRSVADDLHKATLQFGGARSQVSHDRRFAVELDYRSLILVWTHDGIDEARAGVS